MRHFAADLRFLRDNGVRAVFEQGTGLGECSDLAPLRQWLLSRLMWNPDLDQEALCDEFLKGYYGAAAPFLREYLLLGYQALDASGAQLRCNGSTKWLSLDDLLKMRAAFDRAEAAVQADPVCLERVEIAAVSVNHTILNHDAARLENAAAPEGRKLRASVDLEKLFLKTEQSVRKAPDAWREHNGAPGEHFRILKGRISGDWNFRMKRPALCADLADDQWLLFEADSFRRFGAALVQDEGGKAVSLPQDESWALQLHLTDFPVSGRKWRIYARVRTESAVPGSVPAGTFGFFNPGGRELRRTLASGDFNGKNYRLVELGRAEFGGKGYLYFTGKAGKARLFVQEILLVRESAEGSLTSGKN